MKVVEITGDAQRIFIRFDKDVDPAVARNPALYDIGGQRPARVQAAGKYVVLEGLRLDDKEHSLRLSEQLTSIEGVALMDESLECTYHYKYRRRITVAAVQPIANWHRKLPLADYLQYVLELVDEAGRCGSDIVCVPEGVMSEPGRHWKEVAQPIPDGPYARMLADCARRRNMYVNAVVLERLGQQVGQTALLLDRRGQLAGKYHKVFELGGKGIVEGEFLPVFQTDFGVIGTMICIDYVLPELPRVLALKGAEIIFWPHAGGDHAGSEFQHVFAAQACAAMNDVFVVHNGFGREIERAPRDVQRRNETTGPGNFGRSCIIARNGLILADAGHAPGVVTARIDLEARRLACGYGMEGINDIREARLRSMKLKVYEELYRVAKDVIQRREAAGIRGIYEWESTCHSHRADREIESKR